MNRADLIFIANRIIRASVLPAVADIQLVVVVTDESGEFCAVAANVGPKRTATILESALLKAVHVDHQ